MSENQETAIVGTNVDTVEKVVVKPKRKATPAQLENLRKGREQSKINKELRNQGHYIPPRKKAAKTGENQVINEYTHRHKDINTMLIYDMEKRRQQMKKDNKWSGMLNERFDRFEKKVMDMFKIEDEIELDNAPPPVENKTEKDVVKETKEKNEKPEKREAAEEKESVQPAKKKQRLTFSQPSPFK